MVMNRFIALSATLILSLWVYVPATASPVMDDEPKKVQTYMWSDSSIDGARYEVLRDFNTGSPCFRIDKFTGEIWQFNAHRYNYYSCEIEDCPEATETEGQINYQLVVESITHAFLLNLNSGQMWEYSASISEKKPKFKLMTIKQ